MEHLPNQLEIQITPSDIENSKRKHCSLCPLAKAIKRKYTRYAVEVLVPNVIFSDENSGEVVANYTMNSESAKSIIRYDIGGTFVLSSVTLTKV